MGRAAVDDQPCQSSLTSRKRVFASVSPRRRTRRRRVADRNPLNEELDDAVLSELREHLELRLLDLVGGELADPAAVQPADLRLEVTDLVGGAQRAAREPDRPVGSASHDSAPPSSNRQDTSSCRAGLVDARQYASRRKCPPVR